MQNLALAKLQALSAQDKLAHAWLFVGPDNSHKQVVARSFSQWLLCTQRNGISACGICRQCQLYAAGSHPDFCYIHPQEDSTAITIDNIRVLTDFLSSKAQFSQYKIVLISDAEKMNRHAANGLLKNLEEPGDDTLFLILARRSDLLLDTIISRCQVLIFNAEVAELSANSDILQGMLCDLHGLFINQSLTSVELGDGWVKRWSNEVLYCFELLLADLLVCKYTQDQQLLKYVAICKELSDLINIVPVSKFWNMLHKVQEARYYLGNGYKPNLQLLIEDILII